MIAQYIQLGNRDWNMLIYYGVEAEDFIEIEDSLLQVDCPEKDIKKAFKVLSRKNTGFTFSNTEYKMSVICIGKSTNVSQMVNTAIHEAKHVQSHICSYYRIPEDSETAAYLIGYLVQRMYKMFSKIVRQYV